MNIIKKVKELNLPTEGYAVFGSGPLAIRGIRETRDIDILANPKLYEELKRQTGWEEKTWSAGDKYLSKDVFEVTKEWTYLPYNPDTIKLIQEAEIIHGVPFVRLIEVIAWKRAFGREKDLQDLKLIEKYLSSQQP